MDREMRDIKSVLYRKKEPSYTVWVAFVYVSIAFCGSGKVKKSGKDFPYIEEHMTVKVPDPKRTEPIRARLGKKEQRKAELEKKIQEVEAFIARLPEGMDKQIFEMVYLDGMTQREVGEVLGYSEGRISQIISKYLKD
ncbi:MAG: sigma-70 family RNA polymerase sigma factor [Dorea sp.]|jgi:RNA polymerase sigma factor (sigma-70 family)|nr:sigma-70 family RNA polymerase sigma factor [Dorea sp.]